MVVTRRKPKVEASTSSKRPSRRLPDQPPKKATDQLKRKFDENADMSKDEDSKRKVKRVKQSHETTGKLASILMMPFDIQLEILSWLTLKDLTSISHTAKEFCRTLATRGATGIWKLARENDGVPAPPPTMSESKWAALLFGGTLCDNCATPGVHTIDFGLRQRVCRACKRQNLVTTLKFRKEYTEYDEVLLDMIPYTNIGAWTHGRRSGAKFYWLDDIVDMSKKWAALQDAIHRRTPGARQKVIEFREGRKAFVQAITTGVRDYEVWHNGLKDAQRVEKNRKRVNLRAESCNRLQELGYIQTDINRIRWSSIEVNQSRKLTSRIWNRLRPILEAKVQASRKERVSLERRLIFREVISDYIQTLSPEEWACHPSINDVLELPAISSVISAEWDVTMTKEDAEALVPQIRGSVSALQQERKEELQGKVVDLRRKLEQCASQRAQASGQASSPDVDILDLATSVLVCRLGHCAFHAYYHRRPHTDVLFGWQGILLHSSWDLCRPGNVRTNDDSHASFEVQFEISEKGYQLAVELVRMAGLDPETATFEDMDKTGREYLCTICNYPQQQWRQALSHGLSWFHAVIPAKW